MAFISASSVLFEKSSACHLRAIVDNRSDGVDGVIQTVRVVVGLSVARSGADSP